MNFVFKGEDNGIKKYEIFVRNVEDFSSGIPTLRHLLEATNRESKSLQVTFRKVFAAQGVAIA